jgi:hypothetical protein
MWHIVDTEVNVRKKCFIKFKYPTKCISSPVALFRRQSAQHQIAEFQTSFGHSELMMQSIRLRIHKRR